MSRSAIAAERVPFQSFLDQHRGPVLSFLRATVGPVDADDCFQETFIAALRSYQRMDGRHPRAWVMTIARRKAIDHHRARARRPEPRAEPPDLAVSDELPDRAVWSAVARLAEGKRAAVALRYAAGLPYREIAAALRCTEAAARRRVADGLEELRGTIERGAGAVSEIEAREIERVLRRGSEAASRDAAARFVTRADREGLAEIGYATLETPLGTAVLAATADGLVRIALPNERPDRVLEELAAELSPRIVELPIRLDEARRELDEYFQGRRRRFGLALDRRLVRPGFSARVLRETELLPYGVTASYGEIAAQAGSPRAHRAAGSALAHNPIPIVVPCHRVLLAGGRVGNYGGGPEMKEWLLRLEGAIA